MLLLEMILLGLVDVRGDVWLRQRSVTVYR